MDIGELNAGLNALDVVFVKRDGNKKVTGLREGSETLPVLLSKTDPLTGGIELLVGTDVVISSGTAAPNDADGKPDGSIYFQI